jgi:hypothetical protein
MGLVANFGGSPQSLPGAITLDTVAAPLNGNTDNLNPDVNGRVSQFFLQPNAALNLTGIAGGIKNRQLRLVNTTANTVTLKNSTGSAAGNQFIFGADVALAQNGIVNIAWDEKVNGWLLVSNSAASGGGGTPGGTTTQVQYNNAGAFGGMSVTWNEATSTFNLPGLTKTWTFSTAKEIDFTSNQIHINATTGAAGFCVITCSDEFDAVANQINFSANLGFNYTGTAINGESLWLMGTGSNWEVDCDTVLFASVAGGTPNWSIFNALNVGTDSSVTTLAATASTGGSFQTPATGFAITIANATTFLNLNPAGVLATGTINLPAAPIDGQIIEVATTQTITALTVSGNGHTIKNAPTTLTGGAGFSYRYRLSDTTWYRRY